MLVHLHVKNLALIDEVEVDFTNNLNILTGETGAGKSILIDSINIALGGKISKEMIRSGSDYALVELLFDVTDNNTLDIIRSYDLPVDGGEVLISRKISNGRSICKINGETITASVLKEISEYLLDIHGQHEHQSLLYKSNHLDILDKFGGEKLVKFKNNLLEKYEQYICLKEKLKESVIDEDKRLREISFIEYEIQEIDNARLLKNEDKDVASQYKILSNSKQITEVISEIYNITGYSSSNNVIAAGVGIGKAAKLIRQIENYDDRLTSFKNQLQDIDSLLNDFNREVVSYIDEVTYNDEEFTRLEKRLDLINSLKAKYGNSIEDIHNYRNKQEDKLKQLFNHETYVEELKLNLNKLEIEIHKICKEISNIRTENSIIVADKIKNALLDLNFLEVNFEIKVEGLDRFTKNGSDDVEFLISTNPGESVKPLGKVASGGELSRIMLAIKSVLADTDAIETLIFDEIDVGISGRTAQKVSEKLAVIAKNHQVICITHLPQIAAMADSHYLIEKLTKNNKTNTYIKLMNEKDSIIELARLLGGVEITDTVINNAKEMKTLAKSKK